MALFLPQIDYLFGIVSKYSNHEQEQTAQTALFTIKLLAKRLAEKHPAEFSTVSVASRRSFTDDRCFWYTFSHWHSSVNNYDWWTVASTRISVPVFISVSLNCARHWRCILSLNCQRSCRMSFKPINPSMWSSNIPSFVIAMKTLDSPGFSDVFRHELLLTSVIACLSKLVRTLCSYLTPYLPAIIKRVRAKILLLPWR